MIERTNLLIVTLLGARVVSLATMLRRSDTR